MALASTDAQSKSSQTQIPKNNKAIRLALEKDLMIIVFDTFHPFPKLPLELREMIWNYALPPRLIIWHHDRPPAMLHASQESRRIWMKRHKVQRWRTTIFDHETLFVDYNTDILHFERVMPGSKQWTEIPINIKTMTKQPSWPSTSVGNHGGGDAKWLEEMQRLAISSEVALKEFTFIPPAPFQIYQVPFIRQGYADVNPWKKLTTLCPNLRELVVVIGGSLNRDSAFEDWVEVGRSQVPVEPWNWRWDIPNWREKAFAARALQPTKLVELKFVVVRNHPKIAEVHMNRLGKK